MRSDQPSQGPSDRLSEDGSVQTDAEASLASLVPVLDFFSRMTGLALSLRMEEGNELRSLAYAGGRVLPCAVLRADPELRARCLKCDLEHLRLAHRLKRRVIYECHAGMLDIAVPILGLPVRAGVLTGQVLPRPLSSEELGRLLQRLVTPHTSARSLRRAFAHVRFMPEERIEAAAKLLLDLTQYAMRPHSGADVAPLKAYVASELLKGQAWEQLAGVARQLGVVSAPRVALAVEVLCRGWRQVVDWEGLQQARDVAARIMPSALAVVERDKLAVLCCDVSRLDARVRRLHAELQAAGLCVAIGVGRRCDGETPIWESYHDAETALGYRFMTHEPVIFFDAVERPQQSSQVIASALRDLGWLVRLGECGRAREVLRALIGELGRRQSATWVLDWGTEILALLIRELREAGSTAQSLPAVLRHFVSSASRATSIEQVLALLETSATRLIQQAARAPATAADLVERVSAYVQEHLGEPLTLQHLCREIAFVSPDYFSRVFRRAKGTRFRPWVLTQRVERAKQLLRSTGEPIARVAQRCGFERHAYFCRVFRAMTGMTPTQYRLSGRHGASEGP